LLVAVAVAVVILAEGVVLVDIGLQLGFLYLLVQLLLSLLALVVQVEQVQPHHLMQLLVEILYFQQLLLLGEALALILMAKRVT
jgi:hypothetical protein